MPVEGSGGSVIENPAVEGSNQFSAIAQIDSKGSDCHVTCHHALNDVTQNFGLLIVALLLGGTAGIIAARRVQMTQMPELVAILHSLVGLAAVAVGFAMFFGAILLLLLPFCVFGVLLSWPAVRNSWLVREGSPDPGGLPTVDVGPADGPPSADGGDRSNQPPTAPAVRIEPAEPTVR